MCKWWHQLTGDPSFPALFNPPPIQPLLALQVANQHSDSVAVFRRSAASGLLSLASVCSTAGAVAQPTFAGVVPWPA